MTRTSEGSPRPQLTLTSRATLIDRARSLGSAGARQLLGITGPPGAGKSTVAAAVATALGDLAIIVPMDGFHLANQELVRLGRADRKGAPDTFDADGFVALVRRLKRLDPDAVVAPVFRRELDATVQGAIRVPASMPLVIVEGNYLLLDQSPWSQLRELLDECWYVEGRADRVESLIARHVSFGKTEGDARAWVLRSDEANARLVSRTRSLADVIVALGA